MKNAQNMKLDDDLNNVLKKRFVDFYMLDACHGFAFKKREVFDCIWIVYDHV